MPSIMFILFMSTIIISCWFIYIIPFHRDMSKKKTARLLGPWGFSRPEYWSGLPFPPPGNLPDPGIEPRSPALQVILYHLSHQGSPYVCMYGKDFDAGKDWRQKEKGATEDEMVRAWHQHNKHEFEPTPGDSAGQGSLAGCSPRRHRETQLHDWATIAMYAYVIIYCT